MAERPRVALAFSGDLRTTIAVSWLARQHGAELVAVTLDLGQGGELTDVRERALAAGAVRAHVIDAREEFVREYVLPALHAGALIGPDGANPRPSALAHPLIAKRLVDVARMESAAGVAAPADLRAHLAALAPAMQNFPLGELEARSTELLVEDARGLGIDARAPAGPHRASSNLWARTVRGGEIADAWSEPPAGIHALTRPPEECPDEPAYLELDFDGGVPFRANGVEMPVLELIESLDIIGGAHGVGRLDSVEGTAAGKRRTIHEAPAAVLLATAHADLERLVLPADLERVKRSMALAYAGVLDDGRWFSPTREAIDAFVRTIQRRVTGSVRLKLFKGSCRAVGRTSPHALHEILPSVHAAQVDRSTGRSTSRGLIA